jgi:hypothetical protein
MKFTLTIEMGTDAMQFKSDVGAALETQVIPRLGHVREPVWEENGTIKDANGNTVGEWTFEPNVIDGHH